jgi:threonine aldolase
MIDMRRDTVTLPTEEMLEAATNAQMGDSIHGEDEAVNELERVSAELLGMDAGLFVPSGTMANQIAANVLTEPGQEVIVERESHIFMGEVGGLSLHSDLQTRPVDGSDRGIVTPDHVEREYQEEGLHFPGTGLVALETPHNYKGGLAIAPEPIEETAKAAKELDLAVHLDGARIFDAAIANDTTADAYTEHVDTVMFSVSKGLGAPIGSVLVGDKEVIERAHRVRKLFGGGMRQAGIAAGPALVAIENRGRLIEDHKNAKALADGLRGIDGVTVMEPETNLVRFDTEGAGVPANELLEACEQVRFYAGGIDEYTSICFLHYHITRDDVELAVEDVRAVIRDRS